MIYLCPDIYSFELQEALDSVSPERREKALRYRQERDQRLCLAAYRLLQDALNSEYGIKGVKPEFIYNDKGKPLLQDYPSIHFSLSHCHDAAALAIDDRPVGIDIENYDHYSEEVARAVMNDEEMSDILSSPRPAVAFTHLWTMKESLFKLTGDDHGGDIAHMLDDTSAYEFSTFDYPDYLLTTCQHKPGKGATMVKKVIAAIKNCRLCDFSDQKLANYVI